MRLFIQAQVQCSTCKTRVPVETQVYTNRDDYISHGASVMDVDLPEGWTVGKWQGHEQCPKCSGSTGKAVAKDDE